MKAPKNLSKEAAAWWDKIVSQYELDEPAYLILENCLVAFDRMREAQAVIKSSGLIIRDRFDQIKAHPAAAVERDCKQTILKSIKALGLDLEPLHDGQGRPPGR